MAVQIVKSLQYLNFRDRNLQQKFERRLTARFREIKPEKFVSATSVRKHACFRENPGSSARTLPLASACCLRVQAFGAKSQL